MPVSPTASFDAAVDEFVNAAILGDSWRDALEQLSEAAQVTGAVLMSYHTHYLMAALPSRGLASLYSDFFSGHAPPCSRLARIQLEIHEGFRLDHDDYSDTELARDPFYQEFLRPRGAFWNAVAKLGTGPDGWGVELGLKREQKAGPYTMSECRALDAALPRLRIATRIAQRLQDVRAESLVQGLGLCGDLAFELDAWGQVRRKHGTAGAGEAPPLDVRRGRLVAASRAAQLSLDKAVRLATSDRARISGGVLEARDGLRHVLQVLPVTGRARDIFLGTAAIAVVIKSGGRTQGSTEALQEIFSLTRREADVAYLIADGLSPSKVASSLDVGIETVRTHLKNAFAKTGTTRQSELVAAISRLRHVGG